MDGEYAAQIGGIAYLEKINSLGATLLHPILFLMAFAASHHFSEGQCEKMIDDV